VGCHLDCACYEPPYHPAEIDCAVACSRIASLCASDPTCWACTYYENEEACESSCAGIAATWEAPNIATYIASVLYGCAMQDSSCAGMTACSDAHTAQQESVCP
ncbi:MAG TPA: hypothetical protein VFB62_22940, partial [Polyangiaceae bacterium]|nr:hypothetical protein [Polyangiaceae bacterium]